MNRKPIKALLISLLLLLVWTTTAGCSVLGVGAASFGNKVTISWLVRDDPQINPWEYRIVNEFEDAYPNIHVQIVISPGSQYYDQKHETMEVGFEPADVFTMWGNDSWADNVYRNFAADLTPYIQSSHFSLTGMNQKLLDQYSINGQDYAMPFGTGGSYLYYNVDMFKKAHLPLPPTSWDDPSWNWNTVLHDAQVLSTPNAPIAQRSYGLNDEIWPENGNAWLFGGDIFQQSSYQTGVISQVQDTSPAVEQAEQMKQDLIYKYKVMPSPADSSTINGFLSGKVGMDMIGVWGLWTYPPATFQWAIAPLPTFKTNKDVIFTDAWMMAKDSHHPQQAWDFIQWLASPEHGAKSYMETSGAVPPWSQLLPEWAANAHKDMPSLSTAQLMQVAAGSLSHGQESINHMTIGYGEYDTTISTVVANAFSSDTPVPATLAALQQQLNGTIKKIGPLKPLR